MFSLSPVSSSVLMVFHNSFNTLLIQYLYSNHHHHHQHQGSRYLPLPATSVLLGEIFKVGFVLLTLSLTQGPDWMSRCWKRGWWIRLQLMLPVVLYGIQNQLSYLSLRYIDAPTVQILGQLRVLFTAGLSVVMLGKHLCASQWLALCSLMLGALVLNGDDPFWMASSSFSSSSAFGMFCMVIVCMLSSFSGIICEAIMKAGSIPFLDFNLELASWSICSGLVMIWLKDAQAVATNGFWAGHDWLSLATAANCGFGGILISLVVCKTSSISKVHLTVMSNILTCLINVVLTSTLPSYHFVVGSIIVLSSVWMFYAFEGKTVAKEKSN